MKLNAEYMRAAIQVIMDEAGVSPEEIANAAGLNKTAIYKILNGNTTAVRRSTIRQIADGMNYDFQIDGDKVTFTRRAQAPELSPAAREILQLMGQLTDRQQEQFIALVRQIWTMVRGG